MALLSPMRMARFPVAFEMILVKMYKGGFRGPFGSVWQEAPDPWPSSFLGRGIPQGFRIYLLPN